MHDKVLAIIEILKRAIPTPCAPCTTPRIMN